VTVAIPDVEEPTNSQAADDEPQGDLLKLALTDPAECARKMREDWDRSWDDIRDVNEQWKINLWRSLGYLGASTMKVQDRQEAVLPAGSTPSITGLNQALRRRRHLRAYLFADKADSDVSPTTGDDGDADKAEFSARVLRDQCSEGKLDLNLLAGNAFDVGGDFGSGFLHFYIEPEAGGSQPLTIKAHPDALTEDNPLLEAEVQQGLVVHKEYVLRFVKQDGTLTDDKADRPLKRQWLPKLCSDLLNGRHVRFLPGTAEDLWDATGVQIGALVPIRTLKQSFPDFCEKLGDEGLKALAHQHPPHAKDLLPPEMRSAYTKAQGEDALVFVLTRYQVSSRDYPKGCYLVTVGDDQIAYPTEEGQGVWWDEEHDEPLDLPLSQFKHFPKHGNSYGIGAMELFGPGAEMIALLQSYEFEHFDRFADRKTFVPGTSNIRPEQLEYETRTVIPFFGSQGPVFEQVPDFPKMAMDLHAMLKADLDDEAGGAGSQTTQSPNASSGRQAALNLQQVSVILSDLREQTERAFVRSWRVILQLVRARFTIPQIAKFKGDDGLRYEKEWSGSDLLGTADISVRKGSFTQQNPMVKLQTARELFAETKGQGLTLAEYRRIVMHTIGPKLALEDDPHRERAMRQVSRWKEGPPKGWQPPPPQGNPQTGQPTQAPDPILGPLFAPLPPDQVPAVAAMRMEEFGRVIASVAFERHPPAWQQGLLGAYEAARQAAGQATVAEQQQAQQQAAQQQAAAGQQTAQVEAQKAEQEVVREQAKTAAMLEKEQLGVERERLDVAAAVAGQGMR
jgi:hypothetical protein